MHLEGWSIDGFGHFRDHQQRAIPSGLSVILGPNEAGKSTLLAFIRMVLFGAGSRSGDRVPALHGGRHGGRLYLRTGQGLAVVQRHLERKDGLKVWLPGEREGTPEDLASLLGHASAGLFRSVFAFSLTELQDPAFHQQEGIQDRIFAGSLQGSRNTAREAIAQLNRQNDGIHRARARVSGLIDLERRVEEAREALNLAKREASRFGDMQAEQNRLEARLVELTESHTQALQDGQVLTMLIELWPRWSERIYLQAALAQLPLITHLPDRAEARSVELTAHLDQARLTRDRHMEALSRLHHDLETLLPDARLQPLEDEFLAFHAGLAAFQQGLGDRSEELRRVADQESLLAASLARLGPGWTRDRLAGLDASPVRQDEVRRRQVLLARAEDRSKEAVRSEFEAREALVQGQRDAVSLKNRLEQVDRAWQASGTMGEQVGQALVAARRDLERLERLRDAWPAWNELQLLRAQLGDMPEVLPIPDNAEALLTRFVTRLETFDEEVAGLERAIEEARHARDGIEPDALVAANEADIEAILLEQPVFLSRTESLADEQARLETARRALGSALGALGSDWTRDRLETFEPTLPLVDEVREQELALESAGQRVQETTRDAQLAAGQRDEARDRLDTARQRLEARGPVQAIDELASLQDALIALGEQLEQVREGRVTAKDLAERFRELDQLIKTRALDTRVGWSAPVWWALWAGIGVGFLAAALLAPGQPVLAGVVALAAACGVAIALSRGGSSPAADRARAELQQQHRVARQDFDRVQAEHESREAALARMWQALGGTGLPSTADVEMRRQRANRDLEQARERALAAEKLADLQEQLATEEARVVRTSALEGEARSALEALQEAWGAWQRTAGLGEARTPRGALERLNGLQEARRLLEQVHLAESRVADLDMKLAAFHDRGQALVAAIGGSLDSLRERLDRDRTMRQTRLQAEATVQELEKRLGSVREAMELTLAERDAWLEASGARDPRDLIERLSVQRNRESLSGKIQDREGAFEARVGKGPGSDEFLAELATGDLECWQAARANGLAEVERLTHERDVANRTLGELKREREDWLLQAGALSIERLEQDLGTASREVGEAREASERERSGWQAWLSGIGLDETLTPEGALQWLQEAREALGNLAPLSPFEGRIQELQERLDRFRVRAGELLERGGGFSPVPGLAAEERDRELVAALQSLDIRIRSDRALREQRDRLLTEQTTVTHEVQEATSQLDRLEQAFADLLEEAGARDEEDFRARLDAFAQRQERVGKLEGLDRELEARLGRGAIADGLRIRLETGDVTGWEHDRLAAGARAEELVLERDALNRDLGVLRDTLRVLEEASDVIRREHELQSLIEELRQQARAWQVRALARAMIQDTLREVERTAQPEVLRHASGLFERVTGGHHVRLELHETGDLRVVDRHEQRIELRDLSRGTAEQLYLCVRLGLIDKFAREQVALPVVMDDVFVNFDPERAREIAEAIARFAREHQVIVFTCHPATAALLTSVQPDTPVIELPRHGGFTGPMTMRVPVRADEERSVESDEGDDEISRADARERIVACLGEAGIPLGKGEILRRTGLPDSAWGGTIGALKAEEVIVQLGDRKGATYALS